MSPTTWSEPVAREAIAAVMVWPGSKGSNERSEPPEAPAAIATTIVSPMAREMPRTIAATIPEMAAGTTTRVAVVTRRAPRPYDASRSGAGTALIASSETEAMSGIVRTPTATAAAAKLKPLAPGTRAWMMVGLMNVRAKKPRTTLGMPARTSRTGLTTHRTRGLAYYAR